MSSKDSISNAMNSRATYAIQGVRTDYCSIFKRIGVTAVTLVAIALIVACSCLHNTSWGEHHSATLIAGAAGALVGMFIALGPDSKSLLCLIALYALFFGGVWTSAGMDPNLTREWISNHHAALTTAAVSYAISTLLTKILR